LVGFSLVFSFLASHVHTRFFPFVFLGFFLRFSLVFTFGVVGAESSPDTN
jgi:hypothetical protein